jgi:murein DD-endopeptidase MepM/ murein hydrolase activator NlpD
MHVMLAAAAIFAAAAAFPCRAHATHFINSVDSQLFYEVERVSKPFAKKLDLILFNDGFIRAETRDALMRFAAWLKNNKYPRLAEFLDRLDDDNARVLFDVFRKGEPVGSTDYAPVAEAPKIVGQSTVLGFPFKGDFYVVQGNGGSVSHQKGTRNEYAWDFVVMKKGQMFKSASHKNENYYAWGQPVLMPAHGRIVETRFDEQDHPPLTTKLNRANYVIIEHEDGEYSLIYHLRNGSVKVNPGDELNYGAEAANVGDTGVSMFPHIHFELVRRDKDKYVGIPAHFACYFAKRADEPAWRLVISGVPRPGEYVIGATDFLDLPQGNKQ